MSNLPVSIPEDEKQVISLQKNFFNMMSSQFRRIDKFDKLMELIEEKIFTDALVQTMEDPKELMNLHTLLERKKSKAEEFTVKVLDMSNKNQIMTKLVNAVLNEVDNRGGVNSPVSSVDPKVQSVVNMVRQKGLNTVHGPNRT